MKTNSKIYVAGHLGLVGSAIWRKLEGRGYTNLIGRSIAELDLLDQAAVARFFADEKPEFVVLAAARVGGIVANNTYRGQFIYENLQIQNNVIHQSYLHGVKKLLFLGSTCIYPREAPQPMPEDCLLTGELEYTNEPYAIAKIAGLKLCESYNLQYGTNFIAVMPTNLYGPNDNFDLEKSHVLPALIRKIHLGKCMESNDWKSVRDDLDKRPVEGVTGQSGDEEIIRKLEKYGILRKPGKDGEESCEVEIWGSGRPMREFLWSDDLADACVFLMENIDFRDIVGIHKGGRFESVQAFHGIADSPDGNSDWDRIQDLRAPIRNTHLNIGTGQEISIRDLAYLIRKVVGFHGDLIFDPSKPDGTLRKLTDPSKLHALGWHHTVGIEEGVARLYGWYTKTLRGA